MASITEQSAISFLSKLELSAAGLGEVSAAFEDGRTPQAIGILAVSLLFPESTHFPGTSDYERVKEGHW